MEVYGAVLDAAVAKLCLRSTQLGRLSLAAHTHCASGSDSSRRLKGNAGDGGPGQGPDFSFESVLDELLHNKTAAGGTLGLAVIGTILQSKATRELIEDFFWSKTCSACAERGFDRQAQRKRLDQKNVDDLLRRQTVASSKASNVDVFIAQSNDHDYSTFVCLVEAQQQSRDSPNIGDSTLLAKTLFDPFLVDDGVESDGNTMTDSLPLVLSKMCAVICDIATSTGMPEQYNIMLGEEGVKNLFKRKGAASSGRASEAKAASPWGQFRESSVFQKI